MIRINYKHIGFSLERIWFTQDNIKDSKADIIRLIRLYKDHKSLNGSLIDDVYTPITDLTLDEQFLFKLLKKNTRYEINRANDEPITIQNYCSDELKKNKMIIEDFIKAYVNFCITSKQTNLINDLKSSIINSYIENNCFILTMAHFNEGYIYHAYVYDDKNCVLIYSVSDFRNEGINKELAGRANRLLHWRDILYFKNRKLIRYDWGNISNLDCPNGIDKFKMSFGGEIVKVYNVFFANSFKGQILIFLKRFLRTLKELKGKIV